MLIFLISAPRSGSTLLQRILSGHPDIHTAAEPWLMLPPIYALRESGIQTEYNSDWGRTALQDFLLYQTEGEETYFDAVRAYAQVLYGQALAGTGKTFFLDKTPRYYYIIPELMRVFPEAKLIFLLRHPLAVLSSILQTWVHGHYPTLAAYRDDLVAAPHYLLAGIEHLGDKAIVVRYEELVARPEVVVQTLCSQLKLRYHAEMLNYGNRQPLPGRSGDKTKILTYRTPQSDNLEKWHTLLENQQLRHFALSLVHALGEPLLTNLGYPLAEIETIAEKTPYKRVFPLFPWETTIKPVTEWTWQERLQATTVLRINAFKQRLQA